MYIFFWNYFVWSFLWSFLLDVELGRDLFFFCLSLAGQLWFIVHFLLLDL
jgi:hypothetical protein